MDEVVHLDERRTVGKEKIGTGEGKVAQVRETPEANWRTAGNT